MKKHISLFLLTAIAALMSANASERVSYTLKKGWKFAKGDVVEAASVTFDDSAWGIGDRTARLGDLRTF